MVWGVGRGEVGIPATEQGKMLDTVGGVPEWARRAGGGNGGSWDPSV